MYEFKRRTARVENGVVIRTIAINQTDFLECSVLGSCQKKEEPRRWCDASRENRDPRLLALLGGLRLPIKSRTLHLRAQTYEAYGRGAVAGV